MWIKVENSFAGCSIIRIFEEKKKQMRDGIGNFAVRSMYMWKRRRRRRRKKISWAMNEKRKRSVMFNFNLDAQIINGICIIGHITFNSKHLYISLHPNYLTTILTTKIEVFVLKCHPSSSKFILIYW